MRIFVRKDTLRTDLEATKQEVRSASESMQREAKKAGTAAEEAGRGIQRTFGTAFISAITGTAAAFGAVVLAARRLITAWGEATQISDRLRQSIDAVTKSSNAYLDSLKGISQTQGEVQIARIREQIVAIQEEINRLTDPNNPSVDGFMEMIFGGRIPQLQAEAKALYAKINEIQREEAKKSRDAERDAVYQRFEDEAAAYFESRKPIEEYNERVRKERAAKDLASMQAVYAAERQAIEANAALRNQLLAEYQQSLQSVVGNQSVTADSRILAGLLEEIRDSLRG